MIWAITLKIYIANYFAEGRHDNIQMIVMGHKLAQIVNIERMSCDTIYITTYNGADLIKNFNKIYERNHDFHGIISELINSYYNCTDGMAEELRYGMIRYNKKEETFIIFDRNRTTKYDSTVGFIDLKAISLKDELERNEINKFIDYMKPLLNTATDRNTINKDKYQFYFNKLLVLNGVKIQNDVLTKEMVAANWLKFIGYI